MKFDEIHPDYIPGNQFDFEGSFLVKNGTKGQCWNCLEETDWVDGSFGTFLCSEECSRAKWEEYWRAVSG